ncbi:MAG: carbohydrate-binding domain-containing protein [bacterium]|nr:carbohydrate-binding domain-containing protein [bacterium]
MRKRYLSLMLFLAIMTLFINVCGCGNSGGDDRILSSNTSSETNDSGDNDSNNGGGYNGGDNGGNNGGYNGGDNGGSNDGSNGRDTTGGGGLVVDLSGAHYLVLKADGSATLDGETVAVYGDYIWHADPGAVHAVGDIVDGQAVTAVVKNSPAEYYTGTAPSGKEAVYIARDVVYLPNTLNFTGTAKNDMDTEQACYYDDEVIASYIDAILKDSDYSVTRAANFIFATLPSTQAKSTMLHSASEAKNNPVLHINEPGTYVISGTWEGQIWIDGNADDEDSGNRVKIILNGVDVTCTVAPALVFHDVYECGPDDNTTYDVDLSNAGAQVYIADDTTNNFTGANVYRMLRVQPKYDNDDDSPTTVIDGSDVSQQKKRWKMDGAFYSFVSMTIDGTTLDGSEPAGNGVLNVTSSSYEGLNAELHLAINGGVINVNAPDDGINVNEDGYSVFTLNNASLNVTSAGGDGIDSNGWTIINSGAGYVQSGGGADHGLDADNGVYIFGGSLSADSAENLKINEGSGTIGSVTDGPGGEQPGGGQSGTDQPGGNMP